MLSLNSFVLSSEVVLTFGQLPIKYLPEEESLGFLAFEKNKRCGPPTSNQSVQCNVITDCLMLTKDPSISSHY